MPFLTVDDPRVRSSFAYTVAYALAQRADYLDATPGLSASQMTSKLDLDFARPWGSGSRALIRLGIGGLATRSDSFRARRLRRSAQLMIGTP